jgi:hypothetical protein
MTGSGAVRRELGHAIDSGENGGQSVMGSCRSLNVANAFQDGWITPEPVIGPRLGRTGWANPP